MARRNAVRELSLWYVSFFAVERGETRFSPREFIITNVGRDFRPLEVIPLTPGFGEQRLRQNGRQDALYVFDGQLDVQQPLTVSYETARNDSWVDILPVIERERALVKSRLGCAARPVRRQRSHALGSTTSTLEISPWFFDRFAHCRRVRSTHRSPTPGSSNWAPRCRGATAIARCCVAGR